MNEMKKKNQGSNTEKSMEYQNFTLFMALFDALPVIFFCVAMLLIAVRFRNVFFLSGVILCTCAGCGKVLWKILLSAAGKDIHILNRQLRVLMPLGFLLIIIGLISGRGQIDIASLCGQILSFPSYLFFGVTVVGMICMSVFAVKLDGKKAKSNWIEQITNAIAQGCFLLGVISIWK